MSINEAFKSWIMAEGSTRACALARIGLASACWARFSRELLFFRDLDLVSVLTSASFFISTTMMLLGFRSQFASFWSGVTLFFIYHYYGVILGDVDIVHHHVYFLSSTVFLMGFTPCGRSFSIDRWIKTEIKNEDFPERGPLWGTRLPCFQLSMVYLWASYSRFDFANLSAFDLNKFL